QLYVTDMYASVKTRITELKDFTRVHLRPGESFNSVIRVFTLAYISVTYN
ncbi:fibronectin type III-like domain-contianing protein, partial [Bacteroides eggerthii]|nr:fibronectin type III-like domain-contianing protein [Bacteroides eggerthii]